MGPKLGPRVVGLAGPREAVALELVLPVPPIAALGEAAEGVVLIVVGQDAVVVPAPRQILQIATEFHVVDADDVPAPRIRVPHPVERRHVRERNTLHDDALRGTSCRRRFFTGAGVPRSDSLAHERQLR